MGAYYEGGGEGILPPVEIEYIVKELVKRKLFGFFTV